MAKKKKTSNSLFDIISSGKNKKKKGKKKTKTQMLADRHARIARIKLFCVIFAIVIVAAGICVGFFYMDKYVHHAAPVAEGTGPIVLVDQPEWISAELVREIRKAAGGEKFRLNEQTAKTVGQKLNELKWFKYLKVQTTNDSLKVYAEYRKPVAIITVHEKKYYIDKDYLKENPKPKVFKFIPINKLSIVKITGTTLKNPIDAQLQEDIEAGFRLIMLLQSMDKIVLEKDPKIPPILKEIDRIDVSNLNGRKSNDQPHIVLYTTDNTPIFWGMQCEMTTGQIEATDKEKLASLYRFYREKNTLLGRVKHIELRYPR